MTYQDSSNNSVEMEDEDEHLLGVAFQALADLMGKYGIEGVYVLQDRDNKKDFVVTTHIIKGLH